MAPSKKPGHVNKQSPVTNKAVAKKDDEDVKTKQKKRRLGDMLGSPWSNKELQQFYEAYREYGTDWKKVAAAVHSRSVEMVEALYSMNRAYLSLPEGTASVAGLIAMVTDHYSVMERSNSEHESNESRDRETAQGTNKRYRRKYRNSSFKDVNHNLPDRSPSQIVGSNSDCLSLLKLTGGETRAVRKRTPRVPVVHTSDNDFRDKSLPGKSGHKLKMDADDHVAHEIALALTKAYQKDRSPRVSHSNKDMQRKNVSSPSKNDDRMFAQGITSAHSRGSVIHERDHLGSMGSIETDVDNLRRGSNVRDIVKQACSGTEEHNSGVLYKKRGVENPRQHLFKRPKKRSKKILFDEDDSAAFKALNALADLSLTMPEARLSNEDRVGNAATIPDSENKTGLRTRKHKSSSFCDMKEMDKSMSKEGEHERASTPHGLRESEGDFPSKVRNRRKKDLPKSLNHGDTNSCVQMESGRLVDGILNLKAKLANYLSWRNARRWCTFEWFYSAIDYPWFARREFVEYLDHVGLGHIPRLTRVEWGVIRSSLGKPRRFCQQFLKEEKEKLYQYRESVRNHYTELRLGVREGLPADLARPLSVGQHVIAIHPHTREIHDGSVLTVDRSRCRVQFDKPELGVEFVMDIDCMPLDPLENMPTSLGIDKLSDNHHVKLNRVATHNSASLQFAPIGNINNSGGSSMRPLSESLKDNSTKPVKDDIVSAIAQGNARSSGPVIEQQAVTYQPAFPGQSKEADVKALYEMTYILDKKETLVSEFKCVNDEIEENKQKNGSFEVPEHLSKRYASVLVQLDEINDQVASSLRCLRQRNTYQGKFGQTTAKPALGDIGSLTRTLDYPMSDTSKQETQVTEIVDVSRSKAQKMVNAAMQAMSSLRIDSPDGVEEAIDFLNTHLSQEEHNLSAARSFPFPSTPEEQSLSESARASNVQIPSELITNCVATLFMIQKCTEREFPPSDVAQILDSAVASLQPYSSQNLPIYAEIQKCMGIIRSQILALVRN